MTSATPAPAAPAAGRSAKVPDVALSYIRTWTPYLVTGALTWAGRRWGVVLPESMSAELTLAVALGAGSAYYAAARWLERRTGPGRPRAAARAVGKWMLGGVLRQPVYARSPVTQAELVEPDGTARRPE